MGDGVDTVIYICAGLLEGGLNGSLAQLLVGGYGCNVLNGGDAVLSLELAKLVFVGFDSTGYIFCRIISSCSSS